MSLPQHIEHNPFRDTDAANDFAERRHVRRGVLIHGSDQIALAVEEGEERGLRVKDVTTGKTFRDFPRVKSGRLWPSLSPDGRSLTAALKADAIEGEVKGPAGAMPFRAMRVDPQTSLAGLYRAEEKDGEKE